MLILAGTLLAWALADICLAVALGGLSARPVRPAPSTLLQRLAQLWQLRPALLNLGLCAAAWLAGQPYGRAPDRFCPAPARYAFWLAAVAAAGGLLEWSQLYYMMETSWTLPSWFALISPAAFVCLWVHLLRRADPVREPGCRRAFRIALPVVVALFLGELMCFAAWSQVTYANGMLAEGLIPIRWTFTWRDCGEPSALIVLLVPMLLLARRVNAGLRAVRSFGMV